ncbi:hypothetical protein B2J93_2612 [Marssonina coronariae]|uniref:Uncharacterized protein n=1 Tax=Diplocarpon coronariae TaxID=2795749 RepID=A0A218YXI9_9HELO|nr:hypothetical protein B2J93_2612 [Marssonina coronariae]
MPWQRRCAQLPKESLEDSHPEGFSTLEAAEHAADDGYDSPHRNPNPAAAMACRPAGCRARIHVTTSQLCQGSAGVVQYLGRYVGVFPTPPPEFSEESLPRYRSMLRPQSQQQQHAAHIDPLYYRCLAGYALDWFRLLVSPSASHLWTMLGSSRAHRSLLHTQRHSILTLARVNNPWQVARGRGYEETCW